MHNPACLLLFLYLFLTHPILAQNDMFIYGKIPREDLDMKVYSADTAAAAVVLFDYGKITFQFPNGEPHANFERHKRIKILKRAGFGQGDILIPFYRLGSIKNLKAQVMAPDGKVTEVPKKDFFEEKVNDNWSRIRFAFANLCEGCIIEYIYENKIPYFFTLPEWHFQEDIPVRWSEIQLEVPSWLEYVYIYQGRQPDINEKEHRLQSLAISGVQGSVYYEPAEVNCIRMVSKDMAALKKESFITTMDDYYTRLRFQLSGVRFPKQPYKPIMSSWEHVAKELIDDKDFGEQFTKKGNFKKLWESAGAVLAGATTPEEKTTALYQFVNSVFTDDGGYGIYARKDLDELFEKKSARRAEMNLALIALLRRAGIEANPVLTSTRDYGKPVPLYPILDQFNHVMAVVEYPDKPPVLLDAGDPFRPVGLVDVNSLNATGWVVHSENPHWIDIEPIAVNETYFGSFALDEAGNLDGNIQLSADGYSAASRRASYHKAEKNEYWKSEFNKRFPDVSVDSLHLEDKDGQMKVRETFHCNLPAYAQVSGDFIYLSPVFYSSFFENPFKLEKRNYPVDIPYPFKERIVFDLKLPPGYRIESLPESARLALPDNGGRFQYTVSLDGGRIMLNCTLSVTQLHFEPGEYDGLRSFFGMAVEKFGEQVVLKKM